MLLAAAAGLLLVSHGAVSVFLLGLGLLLASNFVGERLTADLGLYERFGRRFMSVARGADLLTIGLFSALHRDHHESYWLFAAPIIVCEALVSRSKRNVGVGAGLVIVPMLGGVLVSDLSWTAAAMGSSVTMLAALLGLVLAGFQARDEMLQRHDRRLQAVLQCTSTMVNSTDLRSMMIDALRVLSREMDARAGYVMLIDTEDSDRLITEVAFSSEGGFPFPESAERGVGLTGYAVKMGQPISVHGSDESLFQLEGAGISAPSAVSVPLIARNYSDQGQASHEQVLGAVTLLGNSPHSFSHPEDLQILPSLGSVIAAAIANARMESRQRETFLKTLESLAKSLEARDTYTRGHSQRVCDVSLLIGEKLGLSPEALEELRIGTILHDIGKIGVPDSILNKPSRLDNDEFVIMKQHPVIGYEICRPLCLSEGVLMIIRNHHEKLDGSGYPDGLKGGELPLSLRIVCVADAFDAMSSRRPYRHVMDIAHVLAELSKGAGTQFDSVVVEVLRELLPQNAMQDIYREQWYPEEALPTEDAA